MTITRAQFQILLEPKLRKIWNESFPPRPLEYQRFLNVSSSKKAQETDYKMVGLGAVVARPEGADVTYGDPIAGTSKVYTHTAAGLGYKVTDMMVRHELYGQVAKMERSLMRSLVDGQETDGAAVLNNAFSTSYVGFTAGEALCATSHARLDAGTAQANRPSTDIDIGVAALQNGIIQFHLWKDDRGRPFLSRPRLLVINPEDLMTVRELLGSEQKPGTANNEINALREEGLSYLISHYIGSDTDQWFLIGDTHDLNFIWDLRPTVTSDEDFDSDTVKRKGIQSYSTGFGEWRGAYGSSGG